ncbi:hypothetical protein BOX15_Mlig011517g2 [Macrostomum lignano]|uniref:Ion transport domain-containing protein n=2 Tax=Macrostomum lignano TaxID=282301 RepID=A0A267FQZ8_9PLAT|nr:hypothetical protein BOX15_Mlig011517g2 [Macrostomum lignano]
MALIQGVRWELKLSPVVDDANQRASLSPTSLGLVLESLSSFAASTSSDSIRRQRYKDSLFHWMIHFLFRETDFNESLLPKEKLSRLLPEYLDVIEAAQFDLNAVVDGKVSIFAAFEPSCPGWLSLSLLRKMPDSFRLNIRDKKCCNLAVVLMRTFNQRYKMLLVALKTLKGKGFNMKCQVMGRYTLLMAFVEICGAGLKEMEADGTLEEERVRQFMEVFNFLLSEGIDPSHSFTLKDVDDRDVSISALSLALSFGVSILVLDLMRRFPAVLMNVSSSTILESIQKFPELLEMLNSKTPCESHGHHHDSLDNSEHLAPPNGHGGGHSHGTRDNLAFENKAHENGHDSRDSVIQRYWHEYVQRHHIGLLKLAIDDDDALSILVLVYDYFLTCDIITQAVDVETAEDQPTEGVASKKKSKAAVKKKKPKLMVEAVRMEQGIFRQPDGEPDRMNSRLMRVMAGNATLKSHPMVTQYLERFYVGSFFVAVFMNLFHLAYLALLVGHLTWVTNNPRSEASYYSGFHLMRTPESYRVTGYFNCPYAKCPEIGFFVHHSADCRSFNSSCEVCNGRLLDSAHCLNGSEPRFNRCPVYDWDRGWFWITPAQYVLLAITAACILKEIYQAVTSTRQYFKGWFQNLIELTMYTLILLSCINVSECPWSSGFRENWQWNVSVVAAFLAWSMMFFYLSRFQVFSTYVMMFYTSVKTGMGVLISFLSFIMAFVQVFHMLLYNHYNFRNYWVSFFKVFDMMTGGLDYNDIFSAIYNRDDGKLDLKDQKLVYDDVLTRFVYFFFVVTMPIVLMNLFIGLIVGDVQQINADAEVKTWTNCVGFIDMTYSMMRWSTVCKRKLKKRRQLQQLAAAGSTMEQGDFEDEEKLEIRSVRLDSIGKHVVTATLLGLVSGRELSRRLLASEKRKLRIKALAKSLHNRLPFLYNSFDLNVQSGGTDQFDLDNVTESGDWHHHHHQHVCDGKDGQPLRRLAVPEDVKSDDPFLRQRRETIIFPNRLNRLRPSYAVDSEDSETGM